jgi:hypothetical protein
MRWICDRVVEAGGTVIANFICPTTQTRAAFGDAFPIWPDQIDAGRCEDTNQMFAPERFDLRVAAQEPQYWAERALALLAAFDPHQPTALFIGRDQPFRGGHQRLIEKGLCRFGQVCIRGARHARHRGCPVGACRTFCGGVATNISGVFHRREVAYRVERIVLDKEIGAISATKIRKLGAVP